MGTGIGRKMVREMALVLVEIHIKAMTDTCVWGTVHVFLCF